MQQVCLCVSVCVCTGCCQVRIQSFHSKLFGCVYPLGHSSHTSLHTCSFNIPAIKHQLNKVNRPNNWPVFKLLDCLTGFLNHQRLPAADTEKQIDSVIVRPCDLLTPAVNWPNNTADATRKQPRSTNYFYNVVPLQCLKYWKIWMKCCHTIW